MYVMMPNSYKWVAVLFYVFSHQAPYIMASLSLKKIDDRATMDTHDIKRRHKTDIISDIIGISILAVIQQIGKKQSGISTMISCLVVCATMAVAVWLINGGGKRLVRRVKNKIKKLLEAKPRLVLSPVPQAR